ncbi:MAG: dUTP diphosphatase [Rhodospirillaceae bacterium]|nr:dUTP diphosphatase [Rhodospirillaceae bacterium]
MAIIDASTEASTGVRVAVQRLPHADGIDLPTYATPFSAGLDLPAAIDEDVVLKPGARALVPTGLAIELPIGFEAQIRPRSGLANRHGVTVLNAPGTIDADYRGEICVILINLGEEDFTIGRAMRIAQMVVAPVNQLTWTETGSLGESKRGVGGFGSTGTHGVAAKS